MDDRALIDTHRLSGLLSAVAPVALEIDPDDKVLWLQGDPAPFLSVPAESISTQRFSDLIDPTDMPIWRLLRHRMRRADKAGPVPLHLILDGTKAVAEVHAVRVAEAPAGTLLLALSPYHGVLSMGDRRRPASSLGRQFAQEDFATLAKRLEAYAKTSGINAAEALIKLAGLDGGRKGEADAQLFALYRLLHDAASEAAAETEGMEKQAQAPVGTDRQGLEWASKGASPTDVQKAVRGAYVRGSRETNYVTVAGEDGISEAEAVKAAVYAMKKAAGKGNPHTMEALTGGYEKRLDTVKGQLRVFKRIVMQEQFHIALQPIVDIETGALHHFEALARFDEQHFKGTPFEFMRFAEDIGVIHEFDLAMTQKVVSLIKRLRRIGYRIGAAVNISGHSIQSPAFLRHFFGMLEDCSDIRDHLMFELTESSQIDDLEATNRVLRRIRDFGHKVSLDDFGAGAAGLQYLRVLKVDYVKIDGVYIRKGIENPQNRSFLRSMADLCTGLGIETVGECVENEEQRDFLKEIGVKYAQGWLYGKPVLVEDLLQVLEQ
ncbi:EAL domain-containing protein [Kordiimonas marina]|uniref:EAL domain-containing protein n=1 Tax=Kordiimonas marina TaxID=2872312 RepID=UPI001FF37EF6|nr:EAL domain-containing protein [Kordiimonas marina]MCJ9430171.1 EAL domain-containing protein [Kordiimonas marina]